MSKPFFVRLEYLTPDGWVKMESGAYNLISPQRFVDRYKEKGKFVRATELSYKTLQPTGREWVCEGLPDPSTLKPSESLVPQLGCSECDAIDHKIPWECLL